MGTLANYRNTQILCVCLIQKVRRSQHAVASAINSEATWARCRRPATPAVAAAAEGVKCVFHFAARFPHSPPSRLQKDEDPIPPSRTAPHLGRRRRGWDPSAARSSAKQPCTEGKRKGVRAMRNALASRDLWDLASLSAGVRLYVLSRIHSSAPPAH